MAVHFSHGALPYPIYGARYSFTTTLYNSSGAQTDPSSPDSEVSKDGGATADCAEEMTTVTGNGVVMTLTGAEMTASTVNVLLKSANCLSREFPFVPQKLPVLASGTLAAGSSSGGTLQSGAFPFGKGFFIKTTGGTGGGGTGGANNQVRMIATMTDAGVFTVFPNWETAVSTDTTYEILQPI